MRSLVLATALALTPLVAGCHWGLMGLAFGASTDQRSYERGAIASELGAPYVRTLGCLDLGFAVRERGGGELLEMRVGNRCGYPEALDLAKLTIRGETASGEAWPVTLGDPRGEIVLRHVGGEEQGQELIWLRGTDGVSRMCLHFDGVAPDAREARPKALCFVRQPAAVGWTAEAS